MKDLGKHYALLTADERFRLFVAATGRRDEQELDRLEATCPRKRYDAQDYEYRRRKTRFTVFALATALRNLETDLLASTALVAAFANYGEGGNPESADRAMQVFEQFMQVRKGKRDGWLRFCEEIGVDADAITAQFIGPAEDAMHMAIGIAESLEAENTEGRATAEKIAARELQSLLEGWEDVA